MRVIFTLAKGYTMNLYECKKDSKCKVVGLKTCDNALKERLLSMGIYNGVEMSLCNHTLSKSSLCVLANGVHIALRENEARDIEVEGL